MSFTVDRRGFLRFAAGGAFGVATSGITLRGISEWNAAMEAEIVAVPDGPESWAVATCSLCPGGCGLRVQLDERVGDVAAQVGDLAVLGLTEVQRLGAGEHERELAGQVGA